MALKSLLWSQQAKSHQTLCSIQHVYLVHASHSGLVGVVPQNILRACFDCGKTIHWSRECPRYEFIIHIELAYVPCQPRAQKECYDCGKDGHSSRECPHHQLVSYVRSTHISRQVRALGVFNDHRETGHQFIEYPQCRIIIHLAHPNQYHGVMVPSVEGSTLSTLIGDLYTESKFRHAQIRTPLRTLGM